MSSTQGDQVREYPADAFYLACDAFELQHDNSADAETVPFRMVVRSREPVLHYGWPPIYHDFAGVRHKQRIPIDYEHEQVIGYGDRFEVTEVGLEVAGALVPYEDDKAREVAHRARAGVPYEASIFWGGPGIKIEEVESRAKAEVNGLEVNGPAMIVREWPLRGAAVCPYGADYGTLTQFKNTDTVSVTVFQSKGAIEMATKDVQTVPGPESDTAIVAAEELGVLQKLTGALTRLIGLGEKQETPDESVPDVPEVIRSKPWIQQGAESVDADAVKQEVANEMKRFIHCFGTDGATWFAEGKTFEEAALLRIRRLTEEKAGLEKKLAALDLGEDEAAEFVSDEDPNAKRVRQFSGNLGDNLGRMAASIRMPGANHNYN